MATSNFLRVQGHDIVDATGKTFFIRGVNVGHWLNPEGYMFGLGRTSSPHFIEEAFRQMVGPEIANNFWKAFLDNYITEADIARIAATGANTVRVPFHYKLFTCEEYLGITDDKEGFRRLDAVIGWCRRHGLRVILDMHDCPGGQTGANIDDSYGYPWLFTSKKLQAQYNAIWAGIAARYAKDPTVLGYDLMNEPISSDLADHKELNKTLAAVQIGAAKAIRSVDANHIVIYGGAQWNTNFEPFRGARNLGSNYMFTCHHYQFNNANYDDGAVSRYATIRDDLGAPMWMGETGHNKHPWYKALTASMERNNIGWTYWPFKMPVSKLMCFGNACWSSFAYPKDWRNIVRPFVEGDRSDYRNIQTNRPDQKRAAAALMQYAENCKAENCKCDRAYLRAIGLKPW